MSLIRFGQMGVRHRLGGQMGDADPAINLTERRENAIQEELILAALPIHGAATLMPIASVPVVKTTGKLPQVILNTLPYIINVN